MADFVFWSSMMGLAPLALGVTWDLLADVGDRIIPAAKPAAWGE